MSFNLLFTLAVLQVVFLIFRENKWTILIVLINIHKNLNIIDLAQFRNKNWVVVLIMIQECLPVGIQKNIGHVEIYLWLIAVFPQFEHNLNYFCCWHLNKLHRSLYYELSDIHYYCRSKTRSQFAIRGLHAINKLFSLILKFKEKDLQQVYCQ